MSSNAAADRPLRRDAEANRRRILAAAEALIAEHGLRVGHDQVARAAGVAVGTVYRRFPDRSSLIEALFRGKVDAVVAAGEAALTIAEPWPALETFMVDVLERLAGSRGLRELSTGAKDGAALGAYARRRIAPVAAELLDRAHRAGVLRPGVTEEDLALVPVMVGAVVAAARAGGPELWRRSLAVVLDGLRAVDRGALPGAAPTSSHMEQILGGE